MACVAGQIWVIRLFTTPEHGPFRERLQEYILERTANYPALVPLVMFQQDQFCFRLACKKTLDGTSWSSWLHHSALDGAAGRLLLDEEISGLLRELGYTGELSSKPEQVDSHAIAEEGPPGFEEMIQIVRAITMATPLESVRVVLASSEEVRFVEVTEGSEFRTELESAMRGGFQALGLLGWELGEKTVQAKRLLFPWHKDNEAVSELFERLCDEGAESVEQEVERRSMM